MDWLAFSLSNQHYLLDAFDSSPHDHHCSSKVSARGSEGGGSGDADLPMLTAGSTSGHKLEEFLHGSCPEPATRFSGDGAAEAEDGAGFYDSDLKIIAAGFLRQSTADQQELKDAIRKAAAAAAVAEPRKVADTLGQRTSIYRGVTRHRWTGRYEAHLWDSSCRREGQTRKGRQIYLGGYDKEEKAARAYDLAALKYWGPTTTTNFPVSNYEKELEGMNRMTRQEFVASLRRKSSGFSRGASIYRGVTRHHQHGRWQARIGRVAGNKDLYLGTFSTQEEAAEAYDVAAIKFRGLNAVTNFDMSCYDVKTIVASNIPIGGMAGRTSPKASNSPSSSSDTTSTAHAKLVDGRDSDQPPSSSIGSFGFTLPVMQGQQHQGYFLLAPQQQSDHATESSSSLINVHPPVVNTGFLSATAAVVAQENGSLLWNNELMERQQQQQQQQQHREEQQGRSNACWIRYATPIVPGSSYVTSGYGGSSFSPVASSMHGYEHPAKTSVPDISSHSFLGLNDMKGTGKGP